MPAQKQERYFDGVKLEDNLYPDSQGRAGYWRYRREDRSFKTFRAPTVQAANKAAKENNDYRKFVGVDRTSTMYAVELYIRAALELRPSLKDKTAWKNRCLAMRQFAREPRFQSRSMLTPHSIWDWWDTLSYHQQKQRAAEFRRMWTWWARKGYAPFTDNPFAKERLLAKEKPPVLRERLALADYWRIYRKAGEMDLTGLQVAMGISLYTTLRRSDVVGLREKINIKPNGLEIVVSKSMEQRGILDAAKLSWSFKKHPVLAGLVDRGLEYGKPSKCPYVVSKKPRRYNTSESKSHSWQVLPGRLSNQFAMVRDRLEIGGKHPPTFHEVRSLGSHLLKQQGAELTDVMEVLGHADEEMAQRYLEGHPIEMTEIQSHATDFGGQF